MTSLTLMIPRILYNLTNSTINWCEVITKRVIKVSKAWIAAFAFGVLLTGCGGASDSKDVSTGPKVDDSVSRPAALDSARSAVLSWSAPDSRVNGDGIKMGELDKYIIHYGQDADDLGHKAVVSDAQMDAHMTHTVSDLDVGIWYFTIQVQDTEGLISAPSAAVYKKINS